MNIEVISRSIFVSRIK